MITLLTWYIDYLFIQAEYNVTITNIKPGKYDIHITHIRPDTSSSTLLTCVKIWTRCRICRICRIQPRYLYAILNYITIWCYSHTRKIRTRRENKFRSHWTLAAENTWMLKGALINANCSAAMQDKNYFTNVLYRDLHNLLEICYPSFVFTATGLFVFLSIGLHW